LWSDPRGPNDPHDDEEWAVNDRGVSYTFNEAAVEFFCK